MSFISTKGTRKGAAGPRAPQVAALCYRHKGRNGVQVLLVTSRDTGRWIVPKGWPVHGLSDAEAAAREAWEEAGVTGRLVSDPLGTFDYDKLLDDGRALPCRVTVHALRVADLARRFPERGQRKRRWFTPVKAAAKVQEPELKALLRAFKPPAKVK